MDISASSVSSTLAPLPPSAKHQKLVAEIALQLIESTAPDLARSATPPQQYSASASAPIARSSQAIGTVINERV
ncbi:hypothetical protein [Aurantivibrio plasticivorans]